MKIKSILGILCLSLCLLIAPAAAAGGSGTAASPYIIENVAELQSIQNDLTAYYVLANDINLEGVQFTPIGSATTPFIGSFDGRGYTISNLTISSSGITGFFSNLGPGAVVKDVTFQDCTAPSTTAPSGVVIGVIAMSSSVSDTAVISNVDCTRCSVSFSTSANTGCLIGQIQSSSVVEISDCDVSYSDVKSTLGNIGCLIGQIQSSSVVEISDCDVLYSQVYSNRDNVGCLVGRVTSTSSLVITNSTAQNSIAESVNDVGVGCLVGECRQKSILNVSNCDVLNCIAKGRAHAGGVLGYCGDSESVVTAQMCTVTDCTIVATNLYAGGIAGDFGSESTGILSGCTVTNSTIISPNYAAGVCSNFA